MGIREKREAFERDLLKEKGEILSFIGAEGYDVYNCSVPFVKEGKKYLYGRVEKPQEWARSRTMLFTEEEKDVWRRAEDSMIYQMEDPNVAPIGKELVLGGVFVRYSKGKGAGVFNLFYRGTDLEDMYYFTTGPREMKDIRLVQLLDGAVGVFSRPRFSSADSGGGLSAIGYVRIDSLDELCDSVIEGAEHIPGVFGMGEWGGANQAYMLDSGKIGLIGHKAYAKEGDSQAYVTVAWVFDPSTHRMLSEKVIATAASFPSVRPKLERIKDCTFPSGIIPGANGMWDLYCGVSDSHEGRVSIPYPFEGFGEIVL